MPPVVRKRSSTLSSATEVVKKDSSTTKKRKKQEQQKNDSDKNVKVKALKDNTAISSSSGSLVNSKINSNGKDKSSPKKSKRQIRSRAKKSEEQSLPVKEIDSMDVAQLLALGEKSQGLDFGNNQMSCSSEASSESGMSDFEEVKDTEINEPIIPKGGVSITLNVPNMYQKHKKKGIDLEELVKRQINKVKRDIQLMMHKVHLLCWIAHIKFVNNTLNTPSLMEISMTLIKSNNLYPSKYADLTYLEGLLKWFHKTIEFKKDFEGPKCTDGLLKELSRQFEIKQAFSYRDFILMFIILLRILGLKARIVMSFQVLPVKPSAIELNETKTSIQSIKSNAPEKNGEQPSSSVTQEIKKIKSEEETTEESKSSKTNAKKSQKGKGAAATSTSTVQSKAITKRKSITEDQTSKSRKKKKEEIKSETSDKSKQVKSKAGGASKSNTLVETANSDDEFESKHFKPVTPKVRKSEPNRKRNKESEVELNVANKKEGSRRSKSLKPKQTIKSEVIKKQDNSSDSDSDDDFTSKSLNKKGRKKNDRKSIPPSEEAVVSKKKDGYDVWTEVYLEAEEKWISVDVPKQKIHCISELYSRATHPVLYVIACNNDCTLKDVTRRYVPNWHSFTRKKRVDEEWWNETIRPYLPPKTAQDKEEDEDINRQLSDKPLPSVISEYKDHPLYALKRHLLKFEGIYPPDAPTLGFVRGEPVYARECVALLHSREMWYKEARVVRIKEEPYKIVKARPKFDKMTGEIKKDLPLELFGRWQTEEYIPPIAVDGKVPRNEYGNVDLFKPCMLPKGTVYLQIPALNRVAKKLGIDCAPATVGFDFHSGGSHPIFDGFVVCEEFKEVLLDAWNKEIDETAKRQEDKKEKRVYGNWKRLIRGLLIREKLKIKYAFGENSDEEDGSGATKVKASTSSLEKV